MKKIFTVVLALCSLSAWAHDFEVDGIYYNHLSGNNVEVTYRGSDYHSYDNEYSGAVTIPASVTYNGTTYSVTSIGEYAFYWCTSLSSVTIPNSVTSIGNDAFYGCPALTSIVVEAGNTTYDSRENCNAIIKTATNTLICGCQNTTIPNSVTSIGYAAFSNCIFLTSITIPNSVTSIEYYAFYNCTSLTSITIPNSVTSIGYAAFSYCSSLPVENNLRYADTYLIEAVDKTLSTYSIKDGTKWIGDEAFSGCSLTSITIPNSVTSIGYEAFSGCSSLTSITIPNSVTSIGYEAFKGTNFTLFICNSTGLTSFGCSFSEQPLLDTIIAPAVFFDVNEASWASSPKHIKYARVISGELTENAFGVINRSYKTLTVLDLAAVTNTTIADEAFKGCYNLDSLYLPCNLTYIPYMAIAECVKLQSITIPATVTEIEDRAFENCRSIKSIIFEGTAPAQGHARHAAASGSSLWRIGSWAFYNCHQLQNLTIPEGVTEIGDAAFYGCTYLEDMVLPSTIQEIGDNGFALCAKLQKIHVKAATPPTIQAKTFFDVNRQIPVYVPDNAVEAYKDDPYWQEFDIQGESKAPSAVDNIQSPVTNTQKIIYDGQLVIIRDGKTYNVMGQEL